LRNEEANGVKKGRVPQKKANTNTKTDGEKTCRKKMVLFLWGFLVSIYVDVLSLL